MRCVLALRARRPGAPHVASRCSSESVFAVGGYDDRRGPRQGPRGNRGRGRGDLKYQNDSKETSGRVQPARATWFTGQGVDPRGEPAFAAEGCQRACGAPQVERRWHGLADRRRQRVSQGNVIGAVGNTGHSFGNHVHFEVRINGSPVDPLGYL